MSIIALQRGVGGENRIGCSAAVVARGVVADDDDKSTSSSIGNDSESESTSAVGSGSQCQEESDEVQSSYKEPLCSLNALEESLPIRYYFSVASCFNLFCSGV